MIFIKKNMGGKMPESNFKSLSIEATMYVKRNTFNRIDAGNIPNEAKLCVCALIEKMNKMQKQAGKKSETVGSWSTTYLENAEWSNELQNILLNYLSEVKDNEGTPVLYRGC